MTLRCSFTTRQSGPVSRRSGSTSGPIATCGSTPGASQARSAPARTCRASSWPARTSAPIGDLGEQRLDALDVHVPRQGLGTPPCRAREGVVLGSERPPTSAPPSASRSSGSSTTSDSSAPVEQLRRAGTPARDDRERPPRTPPGRRCRTPPGATATHATSAAASTASTSAAWSGDHHPPRERRLRRPAPPGCEPLVVADQHEAPSPAAASVARARAADRSPCARSRSRWPRRATRRPRRRARAAAAVPARRAVPGWKRSPSTPL